MIDIDIRQLSRGPKDTGSLQGGIAAALGAVSFLLLVLGYTAAARLDGLSYSPLLFAVVALVVGPFIGVAAAWPRMGGVHAAAGTALLSGTFIGEAIYGLTVIADSTSHVYRVAIGVVGGILLVSTVSVRLSGWVPPILAVPGTAAVAGVFTAAHAALGQA